MPRPSPLAPFWWSRGLVQPEVVEAALTKQKAGQGNTVRGKPLDPRGRRQARPAHQPGGRTHHCRCQRQHDCAPRAQWSSCRKAPPNWPRWWKKCATARCNCAWCRSAPPSTASSAWCTTCRATWARHCPGDRRRRHRAGQDRGRKDRRPADAPGAQQPGPRHRAAECARPRQARRARSGSTPFTTRAASSSTVQRRRRRPEPRRILAKAIERGLVEPATT
jgi:hypothetical protein